MVNKSKENVLVLGGSGFVGSHLVALLQQRGHWVRIVDLKTCPIPGNEYIALDMKDIPQHPEVLEGIDILYHLAWSTIPQTSNQDPGADIQTNLYSSVKLLESCVTAGIKKVIFISSGGTVYGIPKQIPIPEDHSCEPRCSYGITKLGVEKYLELFRVTRGQEYVVLRGANPFGEGQDLTRPLGAVGVFLYRTLRGLPIEIWGDGRVVRDYLYVGDLARALYRCMRYRPPENGVRIFNVGSGYGLSLLELLEAIEEITGHPPQVEFKPSRPLDVPVNILDCRRIGALLGWRPQTTFAEGLQRTWQWLQQTSLS
ncbi:MAG: NAD-dependent epimerase/dehydratase family protein [Deltaproteobacteria bacterium]|nr:NAD-dependent epimerase/dehydratase family protein [Deltaproteobacteria bacterium]MBW2134315.1 NAD-dependent epimerase/dehydratase family protein [Deltaproteobacteria bacterium]